MAGRLVGVLLCLFAALAYAVGVVLQKPTLKHATPMQVTTFGALAGAVTCLPFAGQLVSQVSRAPVSATLQMVYLGVFPTALAFTTWAYAVSRTTVGQMGATTYAVPVLVVVMSWLFLGEVPGRLTLLGGLLCLSGVAVSRMRGKAQAPVPEGVREAGRPRRPTCRWTRHGRRCPTPLILRGVPLGEVALWSGSRYLGSGRGAAEVRSAVCRTIRAVFAGVASIPNFC